ncbi:multidrug resistance protein MdtO [Trinickia symbiotica]|uniref:Recombination protein RecR n=1 Tax=Trinickia symbiotica TaxID=863227 RepID=A0A2N7WWV5_9BURK|nr:FUSC family protein [Trinickia symbiotica]PMS33973.1 recombination protein RecR [Trinickia symbiotica]PPK42467.1 multidrug resistance protein MdtO [Trinickia symbiotica]
MALTDYLPQSLRRLACFLCDEIRANPGRANVMLRCVLASAIVIAVSMTLQVPFLALSLLAVFYVTQSNVVMTRLVGMVFIVGVTLAVGSAILVLKLTYDYPLLRILLSAALFVFSAYMMRVAKIGAAFFLVGLVVIYFQSFVDLTDHAEALVRIALWLWVAINYAIAITLLINSLFLPAEPVGQLESAMLGQLAAVDARLAHLERGTRGAGRLAAREVQSGTLTLQRLLRFATMRDPDYRRRQAFHLARVTTVSRLYAAMANLPESAAEVPTGVLRTLRCACGHLGHVIRTNERFTVGGMLANVPHEGMPGVLHRMREALHAFAVRSAAPESAETTRENERFFVPDAFSNSVYIQFALKTLLAAMVGYLFYQATGWQGVHTIMLSSLIVAQPSLGATTRRSILRIGGAALGSVVALVMVVWVVPRIDGIVGLLMMSLPVIALGAWVSAGSERISYAGTQLMFTFALALLDQFGPTTNLSEIRDRMVGILLGVAISVVVHASLWPEAEGEALRQCVARLLRGIAARLRQQGDASTTPTALWAESADCEAMAARVALEPTWQLGEGQQEVFQLYVQTMLAQLREILLAVEIFDAEIRAQPVGERRARRSALIWAETAGVSLEAYASDLIERPQAVRAPAPVAFDLLATNRSVDSGESSTDAAKGASESLVVCARRLIEQVSTLPAWSVGSRRIGTIE